MGSLKRGTPQKEGICPSMFLSRPRPAQGFLYHLQHRQLLLHGPVLLILHGVQFLVTLVALLERRGQVCSSLADSFAPMAILMSLQVMTVSVEMGHTYLCIAGNVADKHSAAQ